MIQNVYLVSYCFDRLIYSTILKQIQLSMIATGEESWFTKIYLDFESLILHYLKLSFSEIQIILPWFLIQLKFEIGVRIIGKDSI